MANRPTLASIDQNALRRNLDIIQNQGPHASICAVIKADAYGHGSTPIAKYLEATQSVAWFAVAHTEEGIVLREAGIETPILVLGGPMNKEYHELVAHKLCPVISDQTHLAPLAKATGEMPLPFHLKLDTGMSRLGCSLSKLDSLLQKLAQHPQLQLTGFMTHLANADLQDQEMSAKQLTLFNKGLMQTHRQGFKPKWLHTANSAAILTIDQANFNLMRPGLAIYGINPLGQHTTPPLEPILSWTTQPVLIKDLPAGSPISYGGHFVTQQPTRIAVLPVGYADGYRRSFADKASVLIKGKRVPLLGSICMDLCIGDITDVEGVTLQDEVTLIGRQGIDEITVYDLADWADTIPYEITCGLSQRVPRCYKD